MNEKSVTFRVADLGFPKGGSTEETIDRNPEADVSTSWWITQLDSTTRQ